MKKWLLTLIILFAIAFASQIHAQDYNGFKEKISFISPKKFSRYFFTGIGISPFSEYIVTGPLDTEIRKYGMFQSEYPIFTRSIGTGLSLDLRINLVEYFDMASLSLNIPLGYSIGIHTQTEHIDKFIQIPLIIQYNMYLNATKLDLDNRGFYLGGGALIQKVKFDDVNAYTHYTVGRIGYVFTGKSKIHSLDLMIGLNPKKFVYRDRFYEEISGTYNMYFGLRYYQSIFRMK